MIVSVSVRYRGLSYVCLFLQNGKIKCGVCKRGLIHPEMGHKCRRCGAVVCNVKVIT
jgi:hypothetical protein